VFTPGAPSALPEAGVGVPGYYLVLAVATAAFLVALVRWTDSGMWVLAALGTLVTVLATGENPLDGGRLVATGGGLVVMVAALAAERRGRTAGLGAFRPERETVPVAGWVTLLGWLLVSVPLVASRTLLGPVTTLTTDPFARRGVAGVLVLVVSATDAGLAGSVGLATLALVAGTVVCLFLYHPDVALALGLGGAIAGGWAAALVFGPSVLTPAGLALVRVVAVGAALLVVGAAVALVRDRDPRG